MFKQSSIENEIYRSMETSLVKAQVKIHSFNKLAKVADLLSMAADIFDKAGMIQESDDITKIIESLSKVF
jgi:hypothetical protein